MKRQGSAIWQGGLKSGSGSVSTESGTLQNIAYSFLTRFEQGEGTNPEELIAAAHAGCFSMAFSAQLEQAGFIPNKIETTATLTLEKTDAGFAIPTIHLAMRASIPQIDETQFLQIANSAKANCPVSKLMNAAITLEATLES